MKKYTIIYLIICFSACYMHTEAQEKVIALNSDIEKDSIITVFPENTITGKSVYATGEAEFFSEEGYIRILLSNDYDYDLLVYESIPLTSTNGKDSFLNEAFESTGIVNQTFTKIRVKIKDARITSLKLTIADEAISKLRSSEAVSKRVDLINENLKKKKALWRAGETFLSQMTYQEKKLHFGENFESLNGYEYYTGGIYENDPTYYFTNTVAVPPSQYTPSFDWRTRHGADNPSSPYYNRYGNGWMTSVKDQGRCGSCWAFSATGAIEALANLYYNQFLNFDLSEQQLVSCNQPTCTGGSYSSALSYIKTNGIVDEETFPYAESNTSQNPIAVSCSSMPSWFYEKIFIGGTSSFSPNSYTNPTDELKRRIIYNGPMAAGIYSEPNKTGHAMTMIGYQTLRAGDVIWTGPETVTIEENDPRIGQTVWIFKNSYATRPNVPDFEYYLMGSRGWSELSAISIVLPITNDYLTDSDIQCVDKDGDGYYWWGIGPKPASCPECAPDEPDGDDSNPYLGPMNERGDCISIEPLNTNVYINSSETWNIPKSVCGNIFIYADKTLTITSDLNMIRGKFIEVKEGGKLIIDGGRIFNVNVKAMSGSTIELKNNGYIKLQQGGNLNLQERAIFNYQLGKIDR